MERTTTLKRRAAEALVTTLEQILAGLADASDGGDIGWLRTLAIRSAEIEYSVVRFQELDSIGLTNQCRELHDLLLGSAAGTTEFASRYLLARRASPEIATLHDKAIALIHRISHS